MLLMFKVHECGVCRRAAWTLFLLLYHVTGVLSQDSFTPTDNDRCDKPLGLEDGTIPDSSITSSVPDSNPEAARLHGSGAWCFKTVGLNTLVTLTIDLGETRLVSGVQAQGPPSELFPASYHYDILRFKLHNSTLADPRDDEWDICCNGDIVFNARDDKEEIDVVTPFPLPGLIIARHLRLQFITNLRSIGHPSKCFRLEVLGCPIDVVPVTGMAMKAEPSGWIVATWNTPVIRIPSDDGSLVAINLTTTNYFVTVERSGGGEEDEEIQRSVEARRYMLPGPLWGAVYTMSLVVVHQGVNLTCSATSITGTLDVCDPEADDCAIKEPVVFRGPTEVQAAVVGDGDTQLSWKVDSHGWVTPTLALQVTDNSSESEFDQMTIYNDEENVTVSGMEGGKRYTVTFIPQADSQLHSEFSFDLHIIPWSDVDRSPLETGYGAFVSNVRLRADILWNGTLKVTWTPAMVRGVALDDPAQASAKLESADDDDYAYDYYGNDTDIDYYTDTASTRNNTDIDNSTDTASTRNDTDINNSTDTASTRNNTDIDNSTDTASTHSVDGPTSTESPEEMEDPMATEGAGGNGEGSGTWAEISEATASMYTVVVTSDGEEWHGNVTQDEEEEGEELRWDLEQLKFETEYTVHLICYFGEQGFDCGTTKTITDLPLQCSQVDDDLLVHARVDVTAGWQEQEDQCSRSHGHLVSVATEEEDELLLDALITTSGESPLEEYWLGLNMCPEYTGHVWTDGSDWQHSRLPNLNTQLSSTTCCVKASWDTQQQQYVWLGELCNALLPTICEFHPEGMVGQVEELRRHETNTSATTTNITWNYVAEYWTPTSLAITYCTYRSLEDILTDPGNVTEPCSMTYLDVETNDHLQKDLEPFTEYQVSVRATVQQVNFEGEASTTFVRTYPEEPLRITIDESGYMNVMWAQKVAEFGENDMVKLQLSSSSNPDVAIHDKEVPAVGATLDGLTLGGNYTVTMEELDGQRRKETASLLAYPACECENCQVDGLCFRTTKNPVDATTAIKDCTDVETTLATVTNSREVDLLLLMAAEMRDDLWVSDNSKQLKATEKPDTAALQESDNTQVLDNESTTTTEATTVIVQPTDCFMVSRMARAVVVEQCTNAHRAACSHKVPVGEAFSDIKTDFGGNWITLDWDREAFKWKAKFAVRYQRSSEKRYKRALRYMPFEGPPVKINQLEPETDYTIELEANLGNDFFSTSPEFEVSTNNETEASTSAQILLGGISVRGNEIIEIVCSSFLVVACITTMLLFFATGMFYQDCVAQLGFLCNLIASYLLLMVAHPRQVYAAQEASCIVVAVMLHLTFMCAFMFLMLEALTIAHLLVIHIKSPFQKSNWLMVIFAVLVPVLVVGVSAGLLYSDYPDVNIPNCWLNPLGPAVYVETVPIGILVIAAVVLLLNTFCTAETSPELIEVGLRGRQSDCHKLRWVVMALTLELALVWALGVSAYHLGDEGIYIAFCVFTLILAITIVGARTLLDDTFRSKMHRLCCGTELTYKRSEIMSISARSRVGPQGSSTSSASRFSASEERRSQVTATSGYSLPNTPSDGNSQNHVLVRRTYNFSDDDPVDFY